MIGMSRPRRSESTREALLEAGIELLSEQGYHGTGLKQILDTVKVPKGSFYNYFPSKEQFTAEIIERYSEDLLNQFDAYLSSTSDDPKTRLHKVYNLMMASFEQQGCQKGCLLGNLAAEIAGKSAECQHAMQRTLQSWRRRCVGIFEAGQDAGQFRKDLPASELADLFWSTWEGGILRMKIDGNTRTLRQNLELLLDTLFKA